MIAGGRQSKSKHLCQCHARTMEYNVKPSNIFHELISEKWMITCKWYIHRTFKTIVILKPKSATVGFETGTAGMQDSNLMSDRLYIHYTKQLFSWNRHVWYRYSRSNPISNERVTLFRTTFFALFRNWNDSASVVTGIRTKKYRGHVRLWLCSASGVRYCRGTPGTEAGRP